MFSKARRAHTLYMMVVFACFGISTEVFFTAFMSVVHHAPLCDKPLVALAGHSYVWMVFIYGAIPLLGALFHHRLKHWPIWVRLPFYVLLVYIVEFTSGFILEKTTGSCPWLYTEGWNVMGLIRLDYFPGWLLFVFLIERLYVFVNSKVR